jgi:hypothetical protein
MAVLRAAYSIQNRIAVYPWSIPTKTSLDVSTADLHTAKRLYTNSRNNYEKVPFTVTVFCVSSNYRTIQL